MSENGTSTCLQQPPRLQRCRLDERSRPTVTAPYFVDEARGSVRFLLADINDAPVILEFLVDVVRTIDPISVAVGITQPEARERLRERLNAWLTNGRVVVMVVGDSYDVCGVTAGQAIEINREQRKTAPLSLDADYAAMLEQRLEVSQNAKLVNLFYDVVDTFIPSIMPEDCKRVFKLILVGIHRDFQGGGIAAALLKTQLIHVSEVGFSHVVTVTVAVASTRIVLKMGMESKFSIEYGKFLVNGSAPFGERLHDGATEAHLMVGNLKRITSSLVGSVPDAAAAPLAGNSTH